jgi:hypothetical protein
VLTECEVTYFRNYYKVEITWIKASLERLLKERGQNKSMSDLTSWLLDDDDDDEDDDDDDDAIYK